MTLLSDEELAGYRANNDPAYYPDHIALLAHIDALTAQRNTDADLNYLAWVVIANVSEGDWNRQSTEWQDAAVRWRDAWHETLDKPAILTTKET